MYKSSELFNKNSIEHCKRIAKKEDIKLTRTFGREIKKLKYKLRFARKPKNMKSHKKAQTRLHHIAFKIYQDPSSMNL